jgi:hypothetical protein
MPPLIPPMGPLRKAKKARTVSAHDGGRRGKPSRRDGILRTLRVLRMTCGPADLGQKAVRYENEAHPSRPGLGMGSRTRTNRNDARQQVPVPVAPNRDGGGDRSSPLPSHTTGHAGPLPALRKVEVTECAAPCLSMLLDSPPTRVPRSVLRPALHPVAQTGASVARTSEALPHRDPRSPRSAFRSALLPPEGGRI